MVVHRDKAYEARASPHGAPRARRSPRQQYDVPIQAGHRREDHRPRDRQGVPQGRHRQVLRRRHLAQAQAARAPEGGQEAHEAGRPHRGPAGGLPRGARAGRRRGECRRQGLRPVGYAVGREKIREYASAVGETDPLQPRPRCRPVARRPRPTSSRRRCSRSSTRHPRSGRRSSIRRSGWTSRAWSTARVGVHVGPAGRRRRRDFHRGRVRRRLRARRDGLLRVRVALDQPAGRARQRGAMDEHREMTVTPDTLPDLPLRGARRATSTRSTWTTSSPARSACRGRSSTGCGRWPRSRAPRATGRGSDPWRSSSAASACRRRDHDHVHSARGRGVLCEPSRRQESSGRRATLRP
jgi:hypothetical protein